MKELALFRLDTVNQCLWRHRADGDDERISLAPKAFGVLRYLVEHAGRLVTQNELLEALWPDTFVQPEVIKSHILGLRFGPGSEKHKADRDPLAKLSIPMRCIRNRVGSRRYRGRQTLKRTTSTESDGR
jgi:hypothetical protein